MEQRPSFALEAATAALRWYGGGYGYDVTGYDVMSAYRDGLAAAEKLDCIADYEARLATVIADGPSAKFVRESLRPFRC